MVILPPSDVAPSGHLRNAAPAVSADFALFMREEGVVPAPSGDAPASLTPVESGGESLSEARDAALLAELAEMGIVFSFPSEAVIALAESLGADALLPPMPTVTRDAHPAREPVDSGPPMAMSAGLVPMAAASDLPVVEGMSPDPAVTGAPAHHQIITPGLQAFVTGEDSGRIASQTPKDLSLPPFAAPDSMIAPVGAHLPAAAIKAPVGGARMVMQWEGAPRSAVLRFTLGHQAGPPMLPRSESSLAPTHALAPPLEGEAGVVLPPNGVTLVGPAEMLPQDPPLSRPSLPLSGAGQDLLSAGAERQGLSAPPAWPVTAKTPLGPEGWPGLPAATMLVGSPDQTHEGAPFTPDPFPVEASLREAARGEGASHIRASAMAHAPERVISVARQIRDAPEGTTEIHLDPPELGRLRFVVAAQDGCVQLMVHAAQADTADLLRRHIDLLAAELRQAGYAAVDVSVGGGEGRQDQPRPMPAIAAALGEAEAPPPPRNLAQSGLDLRL